MSDDEIVVFKDEEVKDIIDTPKPSNDAFPQPRDYAAIICEAKPSIFSRGFLNNHAKRGSNYGIEFTITGQSLEVLAFQGYRILDSLAEEIGLEGLKLQKKQFDSVIAQLREQTVESRNQGWKPIRDLDNE